MPEVDPNRNKHSLRCTLPEGEIDDSWMNRCINRFPLPAAESAMKEHIVTKACTGTIIGLSWLLISDCFSHQRLCDDLNWWTKEKFDASEVKVITQKHTEHEKEHSVKNVHVHPNALGWKKEDVALLEVPVNFYKIKYKE